MSRRQIPFAAFVLSLASFFPFAFADEACRVELKEGERADVVRPDGEPILRYMFGHDTSSPERTFDTAKVIAHVVAPGGEETLAGVAGGTFPHRRGGSSAKS